MKINSILPFFLLGSLINCHRLTLNEYTSERCSFVNKSIQVQVHSTHDDISIRYLIFHYKDILISDIPNYKNHDKDAPKRCGDDGCGGGYGYDVHFEPDQQHDPVSNGVLNKENGNVSYDVSAANPGFYCIYLDASADYYGDVIFENSFGNLDVDNYTRLSFKRTFYLPLLTVILLLTFLWKYPLKFKRFVGAVWLIQVIESVSLGLVSKYGLNVWTEVFDALFGDVVVNLIIGFILLQISYHSFGYEIVNDDSMIFKDTKVIKLIILAFVVLKCLNGLFFNDSLIPYYDLHFNSIRRYLLLLQYIPYILVYVSIVFEFLSLQKNFKIDDSRIVKSFQLFTIIPPFIAGLKLFFGAFVIHKSNDPTFYDAYFKDVLVLIPAFITDILVLLSIIVLCFLWRQRNSSSYERVGNTNADQAIELDDMNTNK
ncbi:unnamed protein product [Wickerhamomyces anomalus]